MNDPPSNSNFNIIIIKGKLEDEGKVLYKNKDRYEGKFLNGLRNEYGVYYFKNQKKYEGGFRDGMFEG